LIANRVGLIDLQIEEDNRGVFKKNTIHQYLFRQSLRIYKP
jgi:hypothetical protein